MCSGSQGKKGPRRDSSPFYEPLRARWFLIEGRGDSKGPREVRKEEHRGKGRPSPSLALAGNRPWVRKLAVSGTKMPVAFLSVFEHLMKLSPSQTGSLVCLCFCSSSGEFFSSHGKD